MKDADVNVDENQNDDKAAGQTDSTSSEMTGKAKSAEPVRKALRDALSKVDSPEKADEVVRQLEAKAAGQKTSNIENAAPTQKSLDAAAQQVEQAAKATPDHTQAAEVIAETARVIAETKGKDSEAVAQAAQEVLNPELKGKPDAGDAKQRAFFRAALLKRLKPLDALDAALFLKINHLPHTPFLNRFFYFITRIFTGGAIWLALMQIVKLRNRELGKRAFRDTALPIVLATMMVELPLKWFFRRRRPFSADIKAISVGIKPSSWSFPSGHAAAAFSGAFLLKRFFPKQKGLLYAFASLCVFSRVYLGDHYPGDVVSGSVLGMVFAKLFAVLFTRFRKPKTLSSNGHSEQ